MSSCVHSCTGLLGVQMLTLNAVDMKPHDALLHLVKFVLVLLLRRSDSSYRARLSPSLPRIWVSLRVVSV